MKKKTVILLICFGTMIGIAALAVLTRIFPALFSSMAAFPFEQIGLGLAALSEKGNIGNGIAASLWIGLSAIPALLSLRYGKNRATLPERAALWVLSGAVLLALYGTVNPALFCPALPDGTLEPVKMIRAVFGVSVWAAAVLYGVLRLVRLFRAGTKEQLLRYMQTILYVLCALVSGAAALTMTNGVFALLEAASGIPDVGLNVFRLLVSLVPYILDMLVLLRAADLLAIAGTEDQSGIAEAAGNVSRLCCLALVLSAALPVVLNLLQIFLLPRLTHIAVTADIPVVSIAFTVLILLFARLLTENKTLRDDNSLFI